MAKSTNNRSGGLIRSTLIIAFISAALLEAVGLVYHYINNTEWFYTRPTPTYSKPAETLAAPQSLLVLHPYLGFIRRPGIAVSQLASQSKLKRMLPNTDTQPEWLSLQSNSSGFFATASYPVPRHHPDDYLIGIFGGSVGQWFALQGAERLRHALQAAPEFSGRNIRILNFAQGGFKQPQQLLTLSYLLAQGQALDFILNIDGFNELALGDINQQRNIDIAMPSMQHMTPLLKLIDSRSQTTAALSQTVQIIDQKARLLRINNLRANTPSAGIHLLLTPLQIRLQNQLSVLQYTAQSTPPDTRNTLYPMPEHNPEDATDVFEMWAGAAQVMQALSHANGIGYLELVQPNQYASAKPMSAAEQQLALRDNSPFRAAVESYYPLLNRWLETQQSLGLNIKSATTIFDAVEQPLYVDDCCHFNQQGNEILAEFAAQSILWSISNNPAIQP